MPTVLRVKGYRFIIFTNDHPPAHIHVKQAGGGAKINLKPIEVVEQFHLNTRQLREILEIVDENQEFLLAKWQEFQGGDK